MRALDYDDDGRLDVALEGPGAALLLHNLGDGRFATVSLDKPGSALPLVGLLPREVPSLPADAAPLSVPEGAQLDVRTPLASASAAGVSAGAPTGTDSQNFVASAPGLPAVRMAGHAATFNGKIYWTAGQDLGMVRNSVYRYDTSTDLGEHLKSGQSGTGQIRPVWRCSGRLVVYSMIG